MIVSVHQIEPWRHHIDSCHCSKFIIPLSWKLCLQTTSINIQHYDLYKNQTTKFPRIKSIFLRKLLSSNETTDYSLIFSAFYLVTFFLFWRFARKKAEWHRHENIYIIIYQRVKIITASSPTPKMTTRTHQIRKCLVVNILYRQNRL